MTHVDECCENCGRELREGRDGLDLCADCAERDTTAQARRNEIENAQHGMEKRGDARLAGDVLDPVKRMSIGELRRDALDYRDRHVAACVHELAQRLTAARAEAEQLRQRLAQAEADARRVDWLETTQWLLQHFGNGEDTPPVVLSYGGKSYGGNTFRTAIDRAMEEPDPPTATEGGAG